RRRAHARPRRAARQRWRCRPAGRHAGDRDRRARGPRRRCRHARRARVLRRRARLGWRRHELRRPRAARPRRAVERRADHRGRQPTRGLDGTWDGGADFLIASLVGAWAVQQILLALPGFAGVELPIAGHANDAALAILIALVVRMAAETLSAHLYPHRLATAE